MADRNSELIRQLADSFGMSHSYAKNEDSHYDAATGTLYCEGLTIPKHTIEQALEFYKKQQSYYQTLADRDSNAMTQYLYNSVAVNAIILLIQKIIDTDIK